MFELGASLTLKDNFTGAIRRVQKEQSKFVRDVAKARQELERTYRREYQARVNSTRAVREINNIIKATQPLRKEIIQKIAIKEARQNQINEMRNKLNSIHNKVFAPIVKARDNISSFIDNLKSKILSVQTLAGAIVFGAAGKGAYNLTIGQTAGAEQNSVALNTMLGKKGGQDAMSWAYKSAAKTPYNANQVVDGVKRLSTYQLDFKKYLEPMGDLASSMGKPLEQAIDMLGTFASGDKGEGAMRARELGIGKEDWKKVGINFDKQNSMMIDNPQQAMDGLMKIMKNKNLVGSMKNQSGTANGVMSNIGDNVQGMGRKLAGIEDTGKIVPDGMFDTFKKSLVDVQSTLTMFGESDAFERLRVNITKMSQVAGTKLKGFFTYLKDNPKVIDKAFNNLGQAFSFVGQMALGIGKVIQVIVPIVKPFLSMLIEHPKLIVGSFIGMKVIFGIFSGFLGVATMLNNTKLAIGTFKSAINFAKEIGLVARLGGALTNFANFAIMPLKMLGGVFKFLGGAIAEWGRFGMSVFNFLGGSILKLGGHFLRFGGMAIGAVKSVAMFLMANPIIIGIGLAIGAVILLYNAWKHNWGGIREKTASVVGAVKGFVQGLITKFNNTKESMKNMAKTVIDKWNKIKEVLKHPIRSTISVIENVSKKVFGGSKAPAPKKSTTKGPRKAFGGTIYKNDTLARLHEGERVLTKKTVKIMIKQTKEGI